MKQAEHKALRTLDQLLNDVLWPTSNPPHDRRHFALEYVLCRIPEADYRRLADAIDTFCWFIPPAWKRASIELLPATYEKAFSNGPPSRGARVVYFSPSLERTPGDILYAIVAHELAHVVLNHKLQTATLEEYDVQEEEALRCICGWGFKREAMRHKANKRRHGLT